MINQDPISEEQIQRLREENERLTGEKEALGKALIQAHLAAEERADQLEALRAAMAQRGNQMEAPASRPRRSVPSGRILLIGGSLVLVIFFVYMIIKKESERGTVVKRAVSILADSTNHLPVLNLDKVDDLPVTRSREESSRPEITSARQMLVKVPAQKKAVRSTSDHAAAFKQAVVLQPSIENIDSSASLSKYKVPRKAYFHNKPDPSTRRNAFIIHWNNAILEPVDEKNGFVYIVFQNHLGQTSKGWLDKKDLLAVNN
jgi:hypothetical protein